MATKVKNPRRRSESTGYTKCSSCGERFTSLGISRHWEYCPKKDKKLPIQESIIPEKILTQLANIDISRPCFAWNQMDTKFGCDAHITEWEEKGRPRVWHLAESRNQYDLYIDTGYGDMALFKLNRFIGYGHNEITTNESVIVVCKEYYSTTRYIFI